MQESTQKLAYTGVWSTENETTFQVFKMVRHRRGIELSPGVAVLAMKGACQSYTGPVDAILTPSQKANCLTSLIKRCLYELQGSNL